MPSAATAPLPVVVLISGEGSNLQAIINRSHQEQAFVVRSVISSRADAPGLLRASAAGIPAKCILAEKFSTGEDYDAALGDCIEHYAPALVVLAGFMRILSDNIVDRFRGRLINIHPALLPKYPGLHTHRRVLAAGELEHGCSVHFVTEALDGGPVIAQGRVPVRPDDTEPALMARVQHCEHRLYPQVLNWFASGRVKLQDGSVWLDGSRLHEPKILKCDEGTTKWVE